MATLGQFADLSAYRPRATQNPLDALIQGFQTGQALEQLPAQLEQQELAKQLAAQLQQVNLQRAQLELGNLQNPSLAIQKQFEQELALGSLRPELGIRVAGRGEPPKGEIEPIINPITGQETGFVRDIEKAAAGRAALQRAARAAPFQSVGLTTNPQGITQGIVFNPERGDFETRDLPAGVSDIRPKVTRPTSSGTRPLTETARSALLTRAGKFGVISSDEDLKKYQTESGSLDISKLSIAAGRAEREALDSEKEAKLNQVPAEARNKVAAYQAVQKDLERLRSKLDEELASGDIPSGIQDLISGSLAESPGNFFSRAFQRFVLQPAQSKTAGENERLRGAVSASIGRAIAGAALTGTEKQNLIPFSPQAGDSFERLLEKSAGLEQFLANQIEGLSTPISTGGVVSPVATPGFSPTAPSPVRSGNTFRIIR